MNWKHNFCAAGGLLLLTSSLHGQSFSYNDRDLLAVFHKTGSPDLIVDLGPVSQFKSAANLTLKVDGYSKAQLDGAFSNLGGLSWAVLGTVRPGTGDASAPQNTLWLTKARSDVNTQTSAVQRKSNSNQSTSSAVISGVAGQGSVNGAKPWSAGTPLDPLSNTANVVRIPSSDPNSYSKLAGELGTLNGTFGQGSVENTTPIDFTTGFTRSDLYEIQPGSGDSTYMGYFQLGSDGSLSFVGSQVPEPGTYALVALGALMFGAARRFQKQS